MLQAAGVGVEGRAASPTCRRRSASPPRSTCTCRRCCRRAYCSDVHERLVSHKRLANCETADELSRDAGRARRSLRPPPEPAQALIACHRLRLVAKPQAASRQRSTRARSAARFTLVKAPPFDPASLIATRAEGRRVRFAGPDRVRIERAAPTLPSAVALIRDFIGRCCAGERPCGGRPHATACRSASRVAAQVMSSSATGCRRTTSCSRAATATC